MYIYIHKYRKDKKDRPRNCVLLCVKSFKACIRRVIGTNLSCKLSKGMYYYTRKRGNHFYQCFVQFYTILIHKFVVSRSFKIRFCSDLFGLSTLRTVDPSDHWPFGLLTLRTIDPSDHWPFGLMNWHDITLCTEIPRITHCEILTIPQARNNNVIICKSRNQRLVISYIVNYGIVLFLYMASKTYWIATIIVVYILKSTSNTVWFNFQTCVYIYIDI